MVINKTEVEKPDLPVKQGASVSHHLRLVITSVYIGTLDDLIYGKRSNTPTTKWWCPFRASQEK